MKFISDKTRAEDLWSISGNFESLFGEIEKNDEKIIAKRNKYTASTRYFTNSNGVTIRFDAIENTGEKPLYINNLLSKFVFDGGEYEVYTQFDGWCNESKGSWQPLVTSVSASSPGMWESINATPMLAIWNKQTCRGSVFHIVADSAWQISATKVYDHDECAKVVVEAGINRNNLSIEIKPGEEVSFPEIICYNFKNKTDLDCYKLHDLCNTKYPRRHMAVVFNTWLCDFQKITFESVTKQIKPAADIGAEYFVIDAGWFYKDPYGWNTSRGDWKEDEGYGLRGRMKEISDLVRLNGMKFGFWIEPCVAGSESEILKKHRELFICENNKYMLDFSNPEAVNYITGVTVGLIEKYNAEFIKFDFNQEMIFDPAQCAFKKYFSGYNEYIKRLKALHPEVYLESCAGGGAKMSLNTLPYYDSCWLSDNQSVYHSLRIFKDTILRMPPQMIEKWVSVCCFPSSPLTFENEPHNKILSTDDATFKHTVEVKPDFLEGFMQGSPIGLSCDLTLLTPDIYNHVKNVISNFKKQRDFWQKAVCRILTDTETMLVLQYSDTKLSKVKILIYSLRKYQDSITVYPVLDEFSEYTVNGNKFFAKELCESGISVELSGNYSYKCIELEKIK